MKRQKSNISITMKEDVALKDFRLPWPFTQQLLWFPGQGFQALIPDFQALFARLGKTRYRKGRIPIGKVKLQFKLCKVSPKSLFPGWASRERAKKFFQSWYRYQRGCASIVVLKPIIVLYFSSFSSLSAMNLRRQLLHFSVQVHQYSVKVTLLTNRAAF